MGWKHNRNLKEAPKSPWVLMGREQKGERKLKGGTILSSRIQIYQRRKEVSFESSREVENLLCFAANLRGREMRNGSTRGNKVPFPYLLTNQQTKLWKSG